jgi:predicted nucleic acid-binding protein
MRRIFLDTAGLIARWDSRDQWHEPAKQAFLRLATPDVQFITTSYVLLECGNTFARFAQRSVVARFRQELEVGGLLIHPNESDWINAWQAYERGEARQAGIVDQVSFQVMRRFKIQEAFTNDDHFSAAGFQVLF